MEALRSLGPRKSLWLAVSVLAIITSIPQIYLCYQRGSDWNGGLVYLDVDEFPYLAYVNALVDGRPRRADPLIGMDRNEFENLYSIQFLPPYALALTARTFHVSARVMFIVLLPLVTIASALAIYWLIAEVTKDTQLAISGMLAVLCLGTVAAFRPWQIDAQAGFGFFPFLRRYQPAVGFPIFFVLCVFTWRSLTKRIWWAIPAGLALAALIYSYFFLWTAAVAWVFLILLLWFIRRAEDRQVVLRVAGIIGALGTLALVPYVWLLSHRAAELDQSPALSLEATRMPDLFRAPELYCLIILIALAYQFARGKISGRDPEILFATSFAMTPFAVFNQQIVTGFSLQPFHYEHFIANYLAILAAMLIAAALWKHRLERLSRFIIFSSLLLGLTSAVVGTLMASPTSSRIDRGLPLLFAVKDKGTVFASDQALMHAVPGVTSSPPLWVQHQYTFSNIDLAEQKKRFYQHLYYRDWNERQLAEALQHDFVVRAEVFGDQRANEAVLSNHKAITTDEINQAATEYGTFVNSFNADMARSPVVSYAIVSRNEELANLRRWYELKESHTANDLLLYQLKLKETP
ncbi:MAG TPA: hypothetical protein VFR80_14885 [Pyrinomonadaceae bacterium]|nr:hypothetical protein [Pyrinomonadaceae bacterium]